LYVWHQRHDIIIIIKQNNGIKPAQRQRHQYCINVNGENLSVAYVIINDNGVIWYLSIKAMASMVAYQ